jgi:hypothetical protein
VDLATAFTADFLRLAGMSLPGWLELGGETEESEVYHFPVSSFELPFAGGRWTVGSGRWTATVN